MEIIKVPKRINYPDAPVEYFVCLNEGSAHDTEHNPNLTAFLQFYDKDCALEAMFGMANKTNQTIRNANGNADFCVVRVDNECRLVVARAWERDFQSWDNFREAKAAKERSERRREKAYAASVGNSTTNPGWGDF